MPELPEVETTRRLVAPRTVGREIGAIRVPGRRVLRRQVPDAAAFGSRLTGRVVAEVDRIGKYLCLGLDDDQVWVVHLGMTGRLRVDRATSPPPRFTTLEVRIGGELLRFVDPRTFGWTAVFRAEELPGAPMARLGPDARDELPPLDGLVARFARRRAPVKALLLDQRVLAGLGNIYADEVLFVAGIRPRRAAGSIGRAELAALRTAIRDVLEAAIAAGGTTPGDGVRLLPGGRPGGYRDRLSVYGRAGEPCRRCETPLVRDVVAGRGTTWCPSCQR